MKVPVPQAFIDLVNLNGGTVVITSATPLLFPYISTMVWTNEDDDTVFETKCCVYAEATCEEYMSGVGWGKLIPQGYYYKLTFD